jgi:LacI family repressor for deo operon, udp, cdd, tsx, nupC, and nupG
VFCFSDDMAIGAMNALREYGYDIPQDMSVIGFDDITYAALIHPKLTTISQPLEQIGVQCMKLLTAQLNGNPPAQKAYELPFKLVVRQSTCAFKESS